jgi:hypothetical protein
MQIQRSKLLDSLKLALSGCGEDQTFDAAIFHDGWLSSYNETISVSARVEDLAGLDATIKIKDFQKLVQRLKGDMIEITDSEGSLILECGNTHAELAKFPDAISQYIKALNLDKIQWTELPKDFSSMVALCRLDNHKFKFPMVAFDGTNVIADEAIRANFGTLDAEMPKFSLHTAVAKELLAMGKLESYCLQDPWLHVFTASGAIFSCKLHTEAYPIAQRLNKRKEIEGLRPVFTAPIPSDLAEVVDRVETFAVASATGALAVTVQLTPEAMILKTSKEAGNVRESIFLDTELPEGTDVCFEASVPYLREAAKKVQEFSLVEMPTRPKVPDMDPSQWPTVMMPTLLFRGPGFLQWVMVIAK